MGNRPCISENVCLSHVRKVPTSCSASATGITPRTARGHVVQNMTRSSAIQQDGGGPNPLTFIGGHWLESHLCNPKRNLNQGIHLALGGIVGNGVLLGFRSHYRGYGNKAVDVRTCTNDTRTGTDTSDTQITIAGCAGSLVVPSITAGWWLRRDTAGDMPTLCTPRVKFENGPEAACSWVVPVHKSSILKHQSTHRL